MAVQDKYTSGNISGNRLTSSGLLSALNSGDGCETRSLYATFEVAAADSDLSVYRVFKSVSAMFVPLICYIAADAAIDATDVDLGLYKPDLGAVVDKDILADGLNLTAGYLFRPGTALDGMVTVPIESYGKRLFEHAQHTELTKLEAYDIALTLNTAGGAAGTISILLQGVQG